jgi:adenylate cyclase class 2
VRNLELKCHYPDLKRAERIALDDVGAEFAGLLKQTDVYFNVPDGRLKLRHNRQTLAREHRAFFAIHELIFYRRPDKESARTSVYEILPIANGRATEQFFTKAFGVMVRITKSRKVLLQKNLRIHLDTVRGLGKFLEFELIVSPSFPMSSCRKRMRDLIQDFGIQPSQILAGSYSGMLWPELVPKT